MGCGAHCGRAEDTLLSLSLVDSLARVVKSAENVVVSNCGCTTQHTSDENCAMAYIEGLSLTQPDTQVIHSLTHLLTYSLTHLLTYSLTHSPTHSLTHSLTHLQDKQPQLYRRHCNVPGREEGEIGPAAQPLVARTAVSGHIKAPHLCE